MVSGNRPWRHGDPIPNTACPNCGGSLTYNGNYFCVNFGDRCNWALPNPEDPDERRIKDQRAYEEARHELAAIRKMEGQR